MAPKRAPKSPIPAPARKGLPAPHSQPQAKNIAPPPKDLHAQPAHKPWSTSVKGGARGR